MSIFKRVLIVLVFAGLGFLGWKFFLKKEPVMPSQREKATPALSWQEQGVAIEGLYADAEVVDIGEDKFRMYYAVEPEVPGNNLEIYSALSGDGKNWTKDEGVRKTMATFPDVLKLPDKRWRMYFQNAGLIRSAISQDGLSWTDESGIRIDKDEAGFNLENVGAQSTLYLADGTYLMVYRGVENKPYSSEKLPNNTTSIFFFAASTDGLNFQKKGMAVESRNDTLKGAVDGAELVKWDDGKIRLYFWSYKGIYYSVFENSSFSEPVFTFTNKPDSSEPFLPNPPGDPTLTKIGDEWFMYYGQHTKGIYYAVLGR